VNAPNSDRWFFTGLAVWSFLLTGIGFSPTFYLRAATLDQLPPHIVWHGILASIWILFFLLQAGLLSGNQRKLHASLGVLSIPLCLAVAATGYVVVMRAHWRGEPLWGALISLNNLLGLLIFVGLGLRYRRLPEYHKRFMALAIIPFLGPAAARWGYAGLVPEWGIPALTFAPMVALFIYDFASRRSIHPVTAIGFPAIIAWNVLCVFVAKIPAVQNFMRRLAEAAI
jgi:hypothetical protein